MKKVDIQRVKGINVIKPMGEMTFFYLEELDSFLREQVKNNSYKFIYDMTAVTWIDSIGLGLLAFTVKFAILNNLKVCLINPKENIRQLLKLCSLANIVMFMDNIDQAIEYFEKQDK